MRTLVPKVGGADRELGAVILGRPDAAETGTGPAAAELILKHVSGARRASSSAAAYAPGTYGWTAVGSGGPHAQPGTPSMDYAGRFQTNGGSIYIDMGHVEVCTPECASADEYAAAITAQLQNVQAACDRANEGLRGEEIRLFVDNTDRQGNAYGSHLNVSVARAMLDELLTGSTFPGVGFLASFHASSILVTGAGKIGAEDGMPDADYQLSARADFFKTLLGVQTTSRRPLVNARDEALGSGARLHDIFFDAVQLPAANYLQFGMLQLVAAMMEAGWRWMPAGLILSSPLAALHVWSRDLALNVAQPTLQGRAVTMLDHQRALAELGARFVGTGACDEAIPNAHEIVTYWIDTLDLLAGGKRDRAARRVEWLAKLQVLEAAMAGAPHLVWSSPELIGLDLGFSQLRGGACAVLMEAGLVDRAPDPAWVAHLRDSPPDTTRAWTRGRLIADLEPARIVTADWHDVRVLDADGRVVSIGLPDPGGHHRFSWDSPGGPKTIIDAMENDHDR